MNRSIFFLRLSNVMYSSPLVMQSVQMKKTSIDISNCNFQRFSNLALYVNNDIYSKVRVKQTVFSNFLKGMIKVNRICGTQIINVSNNSDSNKFSDSCLYVEDSTFTDSSDSSISTVGGTLILRSSFTSCYSQTLGGAIFCNTSDNLILTYCSFDQCTSLLWGAAIYSIASNNDYYYITMTGCTSTVQNNAITVSGGRCNLTYVYIQSDNGPIIFEAIYERFRPPNYVYISHSVFNVSMTIESKILNFSNIQFNPGGTAITANDVDEAYFNKLSFTTCSVGWTFDVVRTFETVDIYSTSGISFNPSPDQLIDMSYRPALPDPTATPSPLSTTSGKISGGWIVLIIFSIFVVLVAAIATSYILVKKITRHSITSTNVYKFDFS